VVKAGLAHLWFVTIHPFDDGNGRIARAVGDMALAQVLAKARFWQHWAGVPMNDRQIKLLNKLLDGFEGKLTSSTWAAIGKCSQDTALRDITELLERGVLNKSAASGGSTSYELMRLPDETQCAAQSGSRVSERPTPRPAG